MKKKEKRKKKKEEGKTNPKLHLSTFLFSLRK
jgi:hypothetical protein